MGRRPDGQAAGWAYSRTSKRVKISVTGLFTLKFVFLFDRHHSCVYVVVHDTKRMHCDKSGRSYDLYIQHVGATGSVVVEIVMHITDAQHGVALGTVLIYSTSNQ